MSEDQNTINENETQDQAAAEVEQNITLEDSAELEKAAAETETDPDQEGQGDDETQEKDSSEPDDTETNEGNDAEELDIIEDDDTPMVIDIPNPESCNFFKQIIFAGYKHMNLTIMGKNGKYTVSVLPGNQTNIQPLIVTGTPEELDADFFKLIMPVLAETKAKLMNLAGHKDSVMHSNPHTKKPEAEKPEKEKPKPATGKNKQKKKTTVKKPGPVVESKSEETPGPIIEQPKLL